MTQNQSEHALSCKGLTVHLSGKCILKDVDFTIPKGKLCAIIGPNGAGKSTLIRTALGMTPISSGQIEMFGKNSSSQKSKIGYVPQKESVDWLLALRSAQAAGNSPAASEVLKAAAQTGLKDARLK